MNPNELVIKFETVDYQTEGAVTRLVGFARARSLLALLDAADLEANPRTAKVGPITTDIIESIQTSPELFPFKTKGILIASANCRQLERKRYHVTFENPHIEGILDGGHNTLAIGIHILSSAGVDQKALKKIKTWPDFKELWVESKPLIAELKASNALGEGGPLDFLVPLEVLIPTAPDDALKLEEFTSSLFEICAARNNNKQLADEAKANKKGLYDYLRTTIPNYIANRVEWKQNEGGEIKVRDIVALTWIPLSVLHLPNGVSSPRLLDVYNSKGKCSTAFDTLMVHPEVSSEAPDGTHELFNTAVGSALRIAGKLPELYDLVYRKFPDAYNDGGVSRFGGLKAVSKKEDMRTKPLSTFTKAPVDYRYPDGFIMPLVCGLKALMKLDANGMVVWKVDDPVKFLDSHFDDIVRKYKVIVQAFQGDAQKIGKNEGSYSLAYDAFETELFKLAQPA
jgi:hypothetical protein